MNHPRNFHRSAGFTLVELMVALALAAVISVSVAVISDSAQKAYEETTRKVEVYNKFRFALLSLERDFSRWIGTSNLEFFADGRGAGARRNEQWDPGEELPDTKPDEHGLGVVDGGLPGYDEFAYIEERHYMGAELDDKGEEVHRVHDAYQAYFRTTTFVDGKMREANVEYKLLDPNQLDANKNPLPPTDVKIEHMADLALYKIIRYHDISYENDIAKPNSNFSIIRKYIEVCTNITDFRIEYTADNRFDAKAGSGLRTPKEDSRDGKPTEDAVQAEKISGLEDSPGGPGYRKTFGYGSVKIEKQYPRATAYRAFFGDRQQRTDHRPVRFGFERSNQIQFAELTPGDTIFVFSPGDRGGGGGGQGAPVGSVAGLIQMPSSTYTVKTNLAGRLEFVEDIDSTAWSRDQTGLLYKAAFLPDAVRITLRVIDDTKSREPRTLQKVIWVRQKAR